MAQMRRRLERSYFSNWGSLSNSRITPAEVNTLVTCSFSMVDRMLVALKSLGKMQVQPRWNSIRQQPIPKIAVQGWKYMSSGFRSRA